MFTSCLSSVAPSSLQGRKQIGEKFPLLERFDLSSSSLESGLLQGGFSTRWKFPTFWKVTICHLLWESDSLSWLFILYLGDFLPEIRFCYVICLRFGHRWFFFCILKVLLLESMFGGVFSVPVNNPHLRKSGSRLIIANLEGKPLALNLLISTVRWCDWE